MHLLEGPDKGHSTGETNEEEKRRIFSIKHHAGLKGMCSTTVQQPWPLLHNLKNHSFLTRVRHSWHGDDIIVDENCEFVNESTSLGRADNRRFRPMLIIRWAQLFYNVLRPSNLYCKISRVPRFKLGFEARMLPLSYATPITVEFVVTSTTAATTVNVRSTDLAPTLNVAVFAPVAVVAVVMNDASKTT